MIKKTFGGTDLFSKGKALTLSYDEVMILGEKLYTKRMGLRY